MNQLFIYIISGLVLIIVLLSISRFKERTIDFDINQANDSRRKVHRDNAKKSFMFDDHGHARVQSIGTRSTQRSNQPSQYSNQASQHSNRNDDSYSNSRAKQSYSSSYSKSQVDSLLSDGKDIQAVKYIRDTTGMTLGEALAEISVLKRQ